MSKVEVPKIPLRQIVLWTLGIVAIVGCFWFLIHFQSIIPLLLTSLILSTALLPAVNWLESHGVNKFTATMGIFVLIGLLIGLLIWSTIPILTEQSSAIAQTLADGYRLFYERLKGVANILVQRLVRSMPSDLILPAADAGSVATDGLEAAPETESQQGSQFVNGLIQAVAIILLTFFWTLEGNYIKHAIFLLVPMSKRDDSRRLVEQMESKVQGYLLGQGVLCLIIGSLAFLAYVAIGLPNALLLAIFAGLFEAVPIIGPILGAIPAIFVGISLSPDKVVWVVVATLIIQQLENSFLVPRVMKRALGVRPLVTLLSLLAFGSLFGVLGALFALPLAAVLQLLVDRYLSANDDEVTGQLGRDHYSVLHYETTQLAQDIRTRVRVKEDVPSAAVDALEDGLEEIAMDLVTFLAEQSEATS